MADNFCKTSKENIKDLYNELQKVNEKILQVRNFDDCEELLLSLQNIDSAMGILEGGFYKDGATEFIEKTINFSLNFYNENHLEDFSQVAANYYQIDYAIYRKIFEKIKEGFTMGIYVPSIYDAWTSQGSNISSFYYYFLPLLIGEMDGLDQKEQYLSPWLTMNEDLDDLIPYYLSYRFDDMPYIIMFKETTNSAYETEQKNISEISADLQTKGENGLNFLEYLLFQRMYVGKNKKQSPVHPDQNKPVILLEALDEKNKQLTAQWDSENQCIDLDSVNAKQSIDASFAVRECVVIPLYNE